MAEPEMDKTKKMVYNIDAAKPDHGGVKNGGVPLYLMNPAVQVIYVSRGSGKIEIMGLNGKSVLNSHVEAGDLIVVPEFFVTAKIAGENGMGLCSILTIKWPMFEELAGKSSIWEAISPQVQEVALSVDPDFEKLFSSNLKHTTNLLPPTN
ncbi:hypothetical protein K1719_023282 [Acacia pycnantha]|nr:hypothetical protein K1719_023282 [Acacia pycnantha]